MGIWQKDSHPTNRWKRMRVPDNPLELAEYQAQVDAYERQRDLWLLAGIGFVEGCFKLSGWFVFTVTVKAYADRSGVPMLLYISDALNALWGVGMMLITFRVYFYPNARLREMHGPIWIIHSLLFLFTSAFTAASMLYIDRLSTVIEKAILGPK